MTVAGGPDVCGREENGDPSDPPTRRGPGEATPRPRGPSPAAGARALGTPRGRSQHAGPDAPRGLTGACALRTGRGPPAPPTSAAARAQKSRSCDTTSGHASARLPADGSAAATSVARRAEPGGTPRVVLALQQRLTPVTRGPASLPRAQRDRSWAQRTPLPGRRRPPARPHPPPPPPPRLRPSELTGTAARKSPDASHAVRPGPLCFSSEPGVGSVQVPLATQGQGAPLAPPRDPVCMLPSHGDSCTPGPAAFAQRANDQDTGNARGLRPGVRVTSAPPTGRFQTAEAETCPGSHDRGAQAGNRCARRPQETGHAGAGPPSTCRSLPRPRGTPMSPGPRPAPRACPAGRHGPHTRLLRAQAARTRPEPTPRRKPHHRPPAAAAVGTSSSQEELPRAEHRAKGGPAPSLTTQTNMGRTPPPPRQGRDGRTVDFSLKNTQTPTRLLTRPLGRSPVPRTIAPGSEQATCHLR